MTKHRQEFELFYDDGPPYMMGTVSPTTPDEDADDVIARLHQAVEDVTGEPVPKPPAKRMGFV